VEMGKRLEEMRRSGEEIDVELVPAKSLLGRVESDESLRQPRFIRVSPDATMAHIAEFLQQASETGQEQESGSKTEASTPMNTPKVEYFYILDHNNQLRKMFLHDTLFSAFIVSTLGGGCTPQQQKPLDSIAESTAESPTGNPAPAKTPHLMLFFDIAPPDVHSQLPLISEIVSAGVLRQLGVQWPTAESPSVSSTPGVSGGGSGGRESSRPAPDFIPIYRRDKESSTTSSLAS